MEREKRRGVSWRNNLIFEKKFYYANIILINIGMSLIELNRDITSVYKSWSEFNGTRIG